MQIDKFIRNTNRRLVNFNLITDASYMDSYRKVTGTLCDPTRTNRHNRYINLTSNYCTNLGIMTAYAVNTPYTDRSHYVAMGDHHCTCFSPSWSIIRVKNSVAMVIKKLLIAQSYIDSGSKAILMIGSEEAPNVLRDYGKLFNLKTHYKSVNSKTDNTLITYVGSLNKKELNKLLSSSKILQDFIVLDKYIGRTIQKYKRQNSII